MFLSSLLTSGVVFDPKGDSQLQRQISAMCAKEGNSIEYIKTNFFDKTVNISIEKLKIALEKSLSYQESVFSVKYIEDTNRPQLLNTTRNSKDTMTFDFGDSTHSLSENYTLFSYEMYLEGETSQKEIVDLQLIENLDKKTQKSSYMLCLAASHESLSMIMGVTYPFYTKYFHVLEANFDFDKYTDFLSSALNELTSSFELTLQP